MSLLRILLLQARTEDDPMRREEHRSFAAATGLSEERIATHDLLAGPPTLDEVRGFDALMMGGSGDYLVSRGDLTEQQRLFELLAEVVARGHPTFASCFGFQCMVEALGGRIVFDPATTEVGTFELELTAAGRDDPLLGSLPDSFLAQMGRKDRAERLPSGVDNLAESSLCPYQAFRIAGTPIWATQFHPELTEATNRERYIRYLDNYKQHLSEAEHEAALARFHPSPEANRLLRRYLDLVFG